jgi:hypothetical protein
MKILIRLISKGNEIITCAHLVYDRIFFWAAIIIAFAFLFFVEMQGSQVFFSWFNICSYNVRESQGNKSFSLVVTLIVTYNLHLLYCY